MSMQYIESLDARRLLAAVLPSGFTDTALASGIVSPTSLVELPDGRMLVTQKGGALRLIKNGQLQATPAATFSVDTTNERGLLSAEVDPNFATNHYVYLDYFGAGNGYGQVSRFVMNGDTVDKTSELRILKIDPQLNGGSHCAGAIHFGKDGKLYVAVGDNEVPADAQSMTTMHGKLLRINSNGTVPTDNPFVHTLNGALRFIYATGLRNPFTFGVDKIGGNIFINDVGEKSFEEVNVGRAGANYGWPNTEGPTDDPAYDGPIYSYSPPAVGVGVSIVGSTFYSGVTQQFPANYAGQYFFGDYVQQTISTLDPVTHAASPFASGIGRIIDLDAAADGSLLCLTYDGVVHKIQFHEVQPTTTASITAYVVNDKNANGKWDSGETGITGRTVWLDLDNDGLLDNDDVTQTTGANGRFTFDHLAAGTYKLREVVPTGWRQVSPANNSALTITVADGQTKSGSSFEVTTV